MGHHAKRVLVFTALVLLASAMSVGARGTGEAADAVKDGGEPYTIHWYMINTPQKDTDLVFDEVSKYTQKKMNTTAKMTMIDWGDYDQRMPVILASGEAFDLAFTSSWLGSFNFRQMGLKGGFVELTSLLKSYGQGISAAMPKAAWDGSKVDGKIYAVPTIKELAPIWGFRVNLEAAESLGLPYTKIAGYADLDPMLATLKEKRPDLVPLAIWNIVTPLFSLPFDRIGGDVVPGAVYYDNRTNFKVVNDIASPDAKAYFAMMHKWYTAGYLQKDVATLDSIDDLLKTKQWGFAITQLAPGDLELFELQYDTRAAFAPMEKPIITNRNTTGAMQAISKTSRNPARAMAFLNLVYTDKYLRNLIQYGIEGTHYVKVDNTMVDYPSGVNASNTPYMGPSWQFGNQFNQYLMKGMPSDWAKRVEDLNKAARVSPILGFVFDIEPVKSEIAAVTNVWNEYVVPLSTGAVDPDVYLPRALDKFTAAGIDKVIAEEQKQLDAWRKSK